MRCPSQGTYRVVYKSLLMVIMTKYFIQSLMGRLGKLGNASYILLLTELLAFTDICQ